MAQLSDDCFAFGGALLPLAEAQARIAARHAVKAGIERVALAAAAGRVLARDEMAPIDLPPADNSAVDGFAVHFDDLVAGAPTTLPLLGRAAAGDVPRRRAAARACLAHLHRRGDAAGAGYGDDAGGLQRICGLRHRAARHPPRRQPSRRPGRTSPAGRWRWPQGAG